MLLGRQIPRRRLHYHVTAKPAAAHPSNIPAATSRAVSAERNRSNTFNPNATANPGPFPVITFPSTTTPSAVTSASGKCSSNPG